MALLLTATAAAALYAPSLLHTTTARRVAPIRATERITKGEVHGEGGAYVGGYWVPIGEAPAKFNIAGGSNEKTPDTSCPRSMTRHSAVKSDGTYDVAIIGAGCIGAAVARELSKTTASVIMLEAADDVCQGATKGNSGIVHAGFDDKPGSVRAKLCWKGNQMFPQLDVRSRTPHVRQANTLTALSLSLFRFFPHRRSSTLATSSPARSCARAAPTRRRTSRSSSRAARPTASPTFASSRALS